MSDTRIYMVIDKQAEPGLDYPRLVRAKDRHKALRWVMRQRFEVKVAGQDDLVQALEANTVIEKAADDVPLDEDLDSAELFPEGALP